MADQTLGKKMLVLDTNVLVHDPYCLRNFKEHDIVILSVVLEELDNLKNAPEDVGYRARDALRQLTKIIDRPGTGSFCLGSDGIEIDPDAVPALGKLFVEMTSDDDVPGLTTVQRKKADNLIVAQVRALTSKLASVYDEVVLVSNDAYPRILARAQGLLAEEYRTDIAIRDTDLLPTGMLELAPECWDALSSEGNVRDGQQARFLIPLLGSSSNAIVLPNQLVHNGNGRDYIVREVSQGCVIATHARNFTTMNSVFGINALNREQNFAVNLLMDPTIDCVTLLGPAGTGKTLLTVATGFAQLNHPYCWQYHARGQVTPYRGLDMTCSTEPIGNPIGFLPGGPTEKTDPWLSGLFDNIEVIASGLERTRMNGQQPIRKRNRQNTTERTEEREPENGNRTEVQRLLADIVNRRASCLVGGATLPQRFFIIDEVQNYSRSEVKMLLTRAGKGTKVVLMGNLSQIHAPYLSAHSSGLAHMAMRFLGETICAHVILSETVRSPLASLAEAKL